MKELAVIFGLELARMVVDECGGRNQSVGLPFTDPKRFQFVSKLTNGFRIVMAHFALRMVLIPAFVEILAVLLDFNGAVRPV